jgi:hypothetical protein
MEFPVPRSTAEEAVLSLQHIFRVARAVRVDPESGIEGTVVYIVDEGDVNIVAETWRNAFEEASDLAVVVVKGLPRGARVEWHVIRCQKITEEDTPPRLRMAFEEHEMMTAISDLRGAHDVLCMSFGSTTFLQSTRSRYPNMAVQVIPSTAIYSVSKGTIARRNACTIILSE